MNLLKILDSIKNHRILVIGDIMFDRYVTGDVSRISPEAPVPVVAVDREDCTLGAAANVALNIFSLGGCVELCGVIGNDQTGKQIEELLTNSGISFNSRFVKKNADTIVKTRVVARGQQLCRIDYEAKKSIYNITSDIDFEYIESRIKQCDAVILSDYNKGVLDEHNVNLFISWAKKHKKFIALDPKPSNKIQYHGADLITPNKTEAYNLAEIEFERGEDQLEAVCSAIHKKYSPKNLIITLGPEGMLLSINGEIGKIVPTYAREVFDVSGAGDTVISALTLAIASGFSAYDAMRFSNIAAGVVVGKAGTAVASPSEILTLGNKC